MTESVTSSIIEHLRSADRLAIALPSATSATGSSVDGSTTELRGVVCGGPGRPEALSPASTAARPSSPRWIPRCRSRRKFGPVLALIPYDSVDEAMEIANGTVYGLGAHVQGKDLGAARAVAARIRSGQVHINYPARNPHAPFGGYKRSGNGREYGIEGLKEYLETRPFLASRMPRHPVPTDRLSVKTSRIAQEQS